MLIERNNLYCQLINFTKYYHEEDDNVSTKKTIAIIILILILFGLIFVIFNGIFLHDNSAGTNILVCAVDESEKRPGMGSIDMAYLINTAGGNNTPIYPSGMTHPTASEPAEAQAQGAGSKLLLHDALWSADIKQGAQYAKEIVEYNTNQSVGPVVLINTKGLDAIINAASPLEYNGQVVNTSGIDLIREDQVQGASRGEAVSSFGDALINAAHNPIKFVKMGSATISQIFQGNIRIYL